MVKRVVAAVLGLAFAASAWAGVVEDEALKAAALDLNIDGVKAALQKGANPNAPAKGKSRTALYEVIAGSIAANEVGIAKKKAVAIAKILIAHGEKLEPGILFFPIAFGNVELVSLLIDNGASVTADLEGYTPTEAAQKYGQEAVYNLLVSRGGAPVDRKSAAQLKLIEAAQYADVEGVESALKNGAEINGFDAAKATALTAALRRGIYEQDRLTTVMWLLDHGADPNLVSKSGLPLNIFVFFNQQVLKGVASRPLAKSTAEEMLYRLVKAGAKVSGSDDTGRTPLHVASETDNVRAAEILIEEGAKVMPRDRIGKTPLDYAESAQMIKLLKQNGATER